jgi:AraC-like DNA-binding protein
MNNTICEMHMIGARCRERFLPMLKGGPLSQLGVGSAGVSDLRGEYCMSRPGSPMSVVLGTLSGKALLTTDSQRRELRAGDLLIAPKGVNHRYELIRGGKWGIVWFNLSRAIPTEKVEVVPANFLEQIAKEMMDIREEAMVESFLSLEARMAKENYLSVILQRVLHREKSETQLHQERQLRDLWGQVMNDLAKAWTLEGLAEIAGCSAGHLNRLCRAFYGEPAMSHLTRLRMEHGAELLSLGMYKVGSVARLCGYENQFAFSVAFKRRFGISPKERSGRSQDKKV